MHLLISAGDQDPGSEGKGSRVSLRFQSLLEKGARGDFPNEHIKRKAEVRDGATRTMRAEVHLDNRAGLVQPNTFGSASILLETHKNALTLPASALIHISTPRWLRAYAAYAETIITPP